MKKVIGWFSCGVTSAVACKLIIEKYGKENVRIIFIDTFNEDADSYRFMNDCHYWYGLPIERLSNSEYSSIQSVWRKYLSLNTAHGAICSTDLKRKVRQEFQKNNEFSFQAFGFEKGEENRATAMVANYPDAKSIFPLLENGMTKKDCIQFVLKANISLPRAYKLGYNNNNCFNTGCVQGGIGYWQKMKNDFPEKFDAMAEMEHELTDRKGKPVTMLKDQSKGGDLVFLKPHPLYPHMKDISKMKGRKPKPLLECNGFCGINDLSKKNKTEKEINYELSE